jgi:ABC-2 type transport system permease protein
VSGTAGTHTLAAAQGLAVRSLRTIRRLPSAFVPALLMPLVQTIAFSGTFFAITRLPGFPTDRSVNWYMPLAVVMGSGFAGLALGFALIRDLQTGFFDRLRMTPAPRRSLIVGPLLSAWVRVGIVITIVILVGSLFGARPSDGPLGFLLLYVTGVGVSTIGAGWALGLAYRFRDMRAAALMQLSMFVSLFLTSAQTPVFVMTGWLHAVARVNPFTNVLRLARAGFLGEIRWADVWGGLLVLVLLGAAALAFARRGLAKLESD